MPPKDIAKNRKALNMVEKIQLLNYYKETKCSIRKLAKHFNIGKTQAGFIVKQEQILFEQWLSGKYCIGPKRLSSTGLEIDKRMYDWYLAQKNDNRDVTGPALQNKALELARDLGYNSFKASNGWLSKFVKRHGISFKEFKNQCQAKSKDNVNFNNLNVDFDEWSKILCSVIDNYSEDAIFSAIQTGLFFRIVPDDTLYLLEKSCDGETLSADRLTVLFSTSMNGKKEKPLVIFDVPEKEIECLKSVGVDCKSNSFAWLTRCIMNDWLTDFDSRMIEQNKKIVLFLDHSLPSHDCQLSNIRTIYLPNVSSKNQRINQSIIQNFKIIYRLQVLKHLITLKEKGPTSGSLSDYMISVPQALMWIKFSWEELSPSIIHKCFEEFLFNMTSDDACDEEKSVTLTDISDLLRAYDSLINASDYLSIDDYLVTEEDPKPIEILVDVDDICGDDSDDESTNAIPNDISNFYYDSLGSLKQLEQIYLSHDDSHGALLVKQLITHHENVINNKAIES